MRPFLAMLLFSSGVSIAAPTIYQEQNFSIELPDGWQEAERPPESLALVRSPDGAKGLVLMVAEFSPREAPNALEGMMTGTKKAAAKKGIPITGEHDLDINGTTFRVYSFKPSADASVFSATGVAGNRGYSLQGFSGTSDPSTDPEIQGALRSFRLLSPVATSPALRNASNPAELMGEITFYVVVIGVVVFAVQRQITGKKASSPT